MKLLWYQRLLLVVLTTFTVLLWLITLPILGIILFPINGVIIPAAAIYIYSIQHIKTIDLHKKYNIRPDIYNI